MFSLSLVIRDSLFLTRHPPLSYSILASVVRDTRCLQTVSENARLDVNSPGGDDDLELWDQSGFMLRTDVDDPLTNAKYVAPTRTISTEPNVATHDPVEESMSGFS